MSTPFSPTDDDFSSRLRAPLDPRERLDILRQEFQRLTLERQRSTYSKISHSFAVAINADDEEIHRLSPGAPGAVVIYARDLYGSLPPDALVRVTLQIKAPDDLPRRNIDRQAFIAVALLAAAENYLRIEG